MKVVSADTRTEILHALESRQMTASELSRFLDKHVTTVAEHLDLLHQSNLIERIERPGRKWIYYRLSRLGKQILHPQPYKIILVLTLSFISLSFGLLSLPLGFHQDVASMFVQRAALPAKQDAESVSAGATATTSTTQALSTTDALLPLLLVAVSVVGVAYSVRKIRRDYSSFRVPEN